MKFPGMRRALAVVLGSALLGLSVPATIAQAADAELTLTKSASKATIKPGEEMQYTIDLSCSSLTVGCVDATLTDVIPAGLEITSLPNPSAERTVAYDPNTRTLSVQYVLPLSSPPSTNGLPAGQAKKIVIGVRLPAETTLEQGDVLTNTATFEAANADTKEAGANTTVEVPVVVRPVATKTWSPDTAVAQSGDESTITTGIRNASSTSADVRRLLVTDETPATFDRFDVTQLGPVTTYPPGTDRVIVGTCSKPIGSPCAEGEWDESDPQQGGGALSPKAGVDLADVTGVRYTFYKDGDLKIPYSATQGTVETTLKLRDTYRDSGDPINPETKERVRNCAVPRAIVQGDESTSGAEACANFDIIPNITQMNLSKSIFPDTAGNYSSNGAIVVGEDSGVSMKMVATNNSGLPFSSLTITEPDTSASPPGEFDKIDITKGQLRWPQGATSAEVSVVCRSGADPAGLTIGSRPGSGVTALDFESNAGLACANGVYPDKIEVTYTGSILPTQVGQLWLHGTAPRVTGQDVVDRLRNCASAEAIASSTAAAQACATAPVENPRPGVGGGVKNSGGVSTILPCPPGPSIPCQPLTFNLSFRNTGNVPLSNVYLADPVDPTAPNNPFDSVRVASFTVPGSPASVREVWDPTSGPSGAYVPYDANNSALLLRAKGIRIRMTGNLPVGQTFKASYSVILRDGLGPPGPPVTFRNCMAIGIGGNYGSPICNPTAISTPDAAASASLQKFIVPGSVTRPTPGLPSQVVTVKHKIENNGSYYLDRLGLTDKDADFFDAVTFHANIHVNFPNGANRVQVDVCTTGCGTDTWITGTPTSSSSPGLPVGVTAADVNGIRVTFTSTNGYTILPSPNYPSSGSCKDASVCFDVVPRQTLKSDSNTPIPAQLEDTSDGSFRSPIGPDTIAPVTDVLDVVEGASQLKITKGPESRIGPGERAPIDLVIENTGTSPISDPTIVDPLPAQLTFDPDQPGAPPGQHYTVTYVLPDGTSPPDPGSVTFTEVPDLTDPNRVGELRWQYSGWTLPVGAKIKIEFQVKLTPGTPAAVDITNTAGVTGTGPSLTCAPGTTPVTDDPTYGPGLFCLDSTNIRSLAGNAVEASKWSSGEPALKFYNTATDSVVDIDDPACPRYIESGVTYTRYPCVPQVYPGQEIRWLIQLTNAGTNRLTTSTLIDGLPVVGDTGVLLSGQQRGTQWNPRPTMLTPVTLVEGFSGVTTTYTDDTFPGAGFCTTPLSDANPTPCPPSAYPDVDPSDPTTGFQTVMDLSGDNILEPGDSATLKYSMAAPLDISAPDANPVAWNSFAQKSTFQVPGGGTEVLPATEPLKAGVIMPFGKVTVAKVVEGLPPGVPLGPFTMKYSCTVTPEGGDPTVVDSGEVSVVDGATEELPLQPAGADCAIWESDTQGGNTPYDSEENAAHVIVEPANTTPAGVGVTVTNSYQTASLTISKVVTWDDIPPVDVPPVKVTVDCEFPSGSGTSLPGFPATYDLSGGDTQVIDDLPAGAACSVVETDTSNATRVTMSENGGSPVDTERLDVTLLPDTEGGTTVDIDNIYQTGGIQLIKTLTGEGSLWAQGPFVFDVACTGGLGPVEFPDVTLTPSDLETTLSPIPAGYVCTVIETDQGDAQGPNPPTLIATVTIPSYGEEAPGPVEVNADNPYEAGYLSVAKTVDGAGAGLMTDAEFTVNVQCQRTLSDSTTQIIVDQDITLKESDSPVIVTDDNGAPFPLPVGAKCWGTETGTAGATTSVVDYDSVDNAVTVTAEELDITVTATNTYDAGLLRIDKELVGDAARYAQGPEYLFSVECSLGGVDLEPQIVTLTPDDLSETLDYLPVGATCEVWETDGGDSVGTVPRLIDTVTIPADGEPAVVVTATNDYPAGHVTVSKTLAGGAAGLMGNARFTLAVTCERDLVGGGTEVILDQAVTLRGGQSQTLPDPLPLGARCWAQETDSAGATAVSIDHDSAETAVVVTLEDPEVTIQAQNTYDAGSIELVKTLSGPAAQYAQGPFDFSVRCRLGGVQLAEQTASLTPERLRATISGLPVGAVCAVYETGDGDASGTVPRLIDTVTIRPQAQGPVVVSADNRFPAGTLTVTKRVTGSAADLTGAARFSLRVECVRKDAEILDRTITLEGDQSRALSDPLPIGTRCWATETNTAGATNSSVDHGSRSSAVVVSESAPLIEITATNRFDKADLVVKKKTKGSVKSGKKFGFAVTCTIGDPRYAVALAERDRRFELTSGEKRRIQVPTGARCVVKEVDDGGARKTKVVDSQGDSSDGVVVVATQEKVTVTNTFPGSGGGSGGNGGGGSGGGGSGGGGSGGSGGGGSGDSPSYTGSGVVIPGLLIGGLLLMLGWVLVSASRRRPVV